MDHSFTFEDFKKMRNLNDFSYFAQIVSHRGLASASRALGIPKSTLSKRLAELEKNIGARLIQRTSRSFTVTEIGKELYRHVAAMMIEAEAAENIISGRLAEPSGTVRITANIPTAQGRLADILPDLAKKYPKVRIVLNATDRLVDIIHEGFDIAIRAHREPLPDSSLVQRRIGFEPNWLVASPTYFQHSILPVHPQELAALDGILIAPSATAWILEREDGKDVHIPVSPLPRYFADESVALLKAARSGLGIACIPSSFCRPLIEMGELMRVLPDWTAGGVTITLLMPHWRGQLPSVRVVADTLVAMLSATDS